MLLTSRHRLPRIPGWGHVITTRATAQLPARRCASSARTSHTMNQHSCAPQTSLPHKRSAPDRYQITNRRQTLHASSHIAVLRSSTAAPLCRCILPTSHCQGCTPQTPCPVMVFYIYKLCRHWHALQPAAMPPTATLPRYYPCLAKSYKALQLCTAACTNAAVLLIQVYGTTNPLTACCSLNAYEPQPSKEPSCHTRTANQDRITGYCQS